MLSSSSIIISNFLALLAVSPCYLPETPFEGEPERAIDIIGVSGRNKAECLFGTCLVHTTGKWIIASERKTAFLFPKHFFSRKAIIISKGFACSLKAEPG